ncbi:hypothetical protein LINGRAHAP2_LOCUS17925 [Linum grandiflorum]
MSRSGNFFDKTFSIVANILLRIIPTTSGEKEAFTYYRDGVIFSFLPPSTQVLGERHLSRDRNVRNNSTLVEGAVSK